MDTIIGYVKYIALMPVYMYVEMRSSYILAERSRISGPRMSGESRDRMLMSTALLHERLHKINASAGSS